MEHTGLATFLEWFLPVSLRHCFLATYFSYYIKSATTRSIINPIYYILPFFYRVELYASSIGCVEESRVEIQ